MVLTTLFEVNWYIYALMFKVILWCLAIYMLYRFIFGLVIPVSKTASQLKKKMTEMQQQQAYQQQQYARQEEQPQQKQSSTTSVKKDDYLDFEEIR
jgi:membrane protein insertase Oxa1/YidC/SpoIIIJ